MVSRYLSIVLCMLQLSVGYGADGHANHFTVKDVTPELLQSTLPQETDTSDDMTYPLKVSPLNKTTSTLSVQDVIHRLENDRERQLLIDTLKKFIQPSTNSDQEFIFVNIFKTLKMFIQSVGMEFKNLIHNLGKPNTWSITLNQLHPLKSSLNVDYPWTYILLWAFFIQLLVSFFIKSAIPPFFNRLHTHLNINTVIKTLISILVFLSSALILKTYFIAMHQLPSYAEKTILILFALQLGFLILRLSISTGALPVAPEYQTSLMTVFILFLSLYAGYSYVTLCMIPKQFIHLSHPFVQLFWAFMTLCLLWVIHHYRHVIEGMIFKKIPHRSEPLLSTLQRLLSGGVHYLIMIAVILTFLSWFIKNYGMFHYLKTQLILTLSILISLSMTASLLLSLPDYLELNTPRKNALIKIVHQLIDGLAFAAIAYIVYLWVIPVLETQGISTSYVSDKLFGILLIIVLSVLVLQGIHRFLNASLYHATDSQHFKTFIPILDRLAKLVIILIATLLIFTELNMNIMPFIASFSVLGLGIGLASKSIIEDFIRGIFLLQENDFNIGDTVTIDGITGTIENITLRKLHLKDSQGFMNFIPFSNVTIVTNKSRNSHLDKIYIPLPAHFYLNHTVNILEDVGRQLLQNSDFKEFILDPPKFIGVAEFDMSNPQHPYQTVMEFELKTLPGKFNRVASEFRKLTQLAFEEMERVMHEA